MPLPCTHLEKIMFPYALNWLKSFIKKDEGVTAIEYGLLGAVISFVIIAAVSLGFPWSSLE